MPSKPRVRLAIVVAFALGAGLLWWGLRVYTPFIDGRDAIASLEEVTLSGDSQWILIRGRDRHAPIVLFLHGGPGMPMMYLAHAFQRPLESKFLVVQWDRRGAGKSYSPSLDPSKMRVSREISDTIELIEKLRARFGRQQIILVGHSYGSSLGVRVAARRPDLIRAYVGIGQLACSHDEYIRLQDAWIAKQAKERGDTNVYKHAIAGDSYDRETALFRYGGEIENSTSFWSLVKIGLRAPEYSLIDVYDVKKGVDFTHANLQDDVGKPDVPLMKEDTKLGVPVFFFEGRQDYTDPSACAEQYFQQLHAPYKRIVWFEHSAHFPFLEETAKFASALDQVAEETSARRRSGTNAN